jgi:hypothetical protein
MMEARRSLSYSDVDLLRAERYGYQQSFIQATNEKSFELINRSNFLRHSYEKLRCFEERAVQYPPHEDGKDKRPKRKRRQNCNIGRGLAFGRVNE